MRRSSYISKSTYIGSRVGGNLSLPKQWSCFVRSISVLINVFVFHRQRIQVGSTPMVLPAVTTVKILTDKIFIIALH